MHGGAVWEYPYFYITESSRFLKWFEIIPDHNIIKSLKSAKINRNFLNFWDMWILGRIRGSGDTNNNGDYKHEIIKPKPIKIRTIETR